MPNKYAVGDLWQMPVQSPAGSSAPCLRAVAKGWGMDPGRIKTASKRDLIDFIWQSQQRETAAKTETSPDAPTADTDPGPGEDTGGQPGGNPGEASTVGAATEETADKPAAKPKPAEGQTGEGQTGDNPDEQDGTGEGEPGENETDPGSEESSRKPVKLSDLPEELQRVLKMGELATGKTMEQLLKELEDKLAPPAPQPAPGRKPKRTDPHPKYSLLVSLLKHKDMTGRPPTPALVGPAGTGKTTACMMAAEELGIAYRAITCGPATSQSDLFGYRDAHGHYVRSIIRDWAEDGGLLLLDEFDALNPRHSVTLNTLIEQRVATYPDGVTVKCRPGCRIVVCANTNFAGASTIHNARQKQDGAVVTRFRVIDWFLHEPTERRIAKLYVHPEHKAGNQLCEMWCGLIQAARNVADSIGINETVPLSPRATYGGVDLITAGFEAREAFSLVYLGGIDKTSAELIMKNPVVGQLMSEIEQTIKAYKEA